MRHKAPFPWFGGKSRVADLVWDRFGDVANYVEPFAGSLAVLLGRPTEPRVETVNDLDCYLANFWRAIAADPEAVAAHADWPVNEADLHARHLWLVREADTVVSAEQDPPGAFLKYRISFRERMKTDPDFFDAKIAGWWVWGISQWIGGGWCNVDRTHGHGTDSIRNDGLRQRRRPHLGNDQAIFSQSGRGDKRPLLSDHSGGVGVHKATISRQLPSLRGDSGAAEQGVHRKRVATMTAGKGVVRPWRVRPSMSPEAPGIASANVSSDNLHAWFSALAQRLRRVRVCCGDWKRVMGPAVTTCIGTTAVFLDPPYSVADRSDVYSHESREVAQEVAEWARANGDNPDLRIALCGYEGEHDMPDTWECVAWKAAGGYGSQGDGTGRKNAGRERVWFSPACLTAPLFDGLENDP